MSSALLLSPRSGHARQTKILFCSRKSSGINLSMGHVISAKLAPSRPRPLTLDRPGWLAPHAERLMLGGGRERGVRRFRCAMCDHFGPKPHTKVKLRSPNCAFDALADRSGPGWRDQALLAVPPDAPDRDASSRKENAARSARSLDLFACASLAKYRLIAAVKRRCYRTSVRGKSGWRGGGG